MITAFAISGALAGLGGFMFAARFASVDAIAGRGFELDVVTAVVIGGVNVFGGSGSVFGAVLGALLVADDPQRLHAAPHLRVLEDLLRGTAIVVAVTIDALITQRLQDALRERRRARDGRRRLDSGQEA